MARCPWSLPWPEGTAQDRNIVLPPSQAVDHPSLVLNCALDIPVEYVLPPRPPGPSPSPSPDPICHHVFHCGLQLSTYFDVEIYASRLNYYRDGTDWKPFHHDSHAYGGRAEREDMTVGASFGANRDLTFLHEPSGHTFSFPQQNGDVFAFTTVVNKRFKHGVPKSTAKVPRPPLCVRSCGSPFAQLCTLVRVLRARACDLPFRHTHRHPHHTKPWW